MDPPLALLLAALVPLLAAAGAGAAAWVARGRELAAVERAHAAEDAQRTENEAEAVQALDLAREQVAAGTALAERLRAVAGSLAVGAARRRRPGELLRPVPALPAAPDRDAGGAAPAVPAAPAGRDLPRAVGPLPGGSGSGGPAGVEPRADV